MCCERTAEQIEIPFSCADVLLRISYLAVNVRFNDQSECVMLSRNDSKLVADYLQLKKQLLRHTTSV